LPLAEQINVFMMLVGTGMLAGFCFDVYRVVRDALRLKKTGTYFGDIFFWLLLTGLAFCLLLKYNAGEVRIYVFVGLALGSLLYMQLLSGYAYRMLKRCLLILGRITKLVLVVLLFVWKIVTTPFKITFLVIAFPFQLLARVYYSVGRGIKKYGAPVYPLLAGKAKKCLSLCIKTIWTKLKPRRYK